MTMTGNENQSKSKFLIHWCCLSRFYQISAEFFPEVLSAHDIDDDVDNKPKQYSPSSPPLHSCLLRSCTFKAAAAVEGWIASIVITFFFNPFSPGHSFAHPFTNLAHPLLSEYNSSDDPPWSDAGNRLILRVLDPRFTSWNGDDCKNKKDPKNKTSLVNGRPRCVEGAANIC